MTSRSNKIGDTKKREKKISANSNKLKDNTPTHTMEENEMKRNSNKLSKHNVSMQTDRESYD